VATALRDPDGYSIERLDSSIHRREGFSCGAAPLDEYLETQASQSQNKNNSTTHVLLENNLEDQKIRQIVGYVTLTPVTIPLTDPPRVLKKNARETAIHAQLIARMAVDRKHQGKRLGEFLLMYALKCCWEISQMSACPAVFVDAKDENVKNFYTRFGFHELSERPLRLYLPIKLVSEILSD